MFKKLKPRLLTVCTIALLISACASDPVGQPTRRTDFSYNQSKNQSNDIWQRVRDGYTMPDLYNAEVTSKENYYATRADYVGRMASRSGDFMYLIMNEVERRKMPSEIALLPFVESAFVTTAQSPVKAAGLWQFMPATGRDFALQQNHFADQRNDVVASTDAALTFLQRLYDQFGDWHLALAAYNWGPGNVGKAVRRAQANGLAGTYEDIKMPTETRQYVPKLQAIKNIVKNPAQYGISLPDISNNLRHEVVTVTRDIDVATAARLSGLDTEAFKRINPAYKKTVIAASLGSKILVPADRANDVRNALRDNFQSLSSVTTYTTYNLENLDDIAAKFKTNADNLRYLNNIPSYHNFVKAGSALLVPRTSNRSDQDIPYGALTAGLSTTAGDIGLNSGDFIEQPTLIVANTDEATRMERSGVINPLNDPLPASTALIVRNTPSSFVQPTQATAKFIPIVEQAPQAVATTFTPIVAAAAPVATAKFIPIVEEAAPVVDTAKFIPIVEQAAPVVAAVSQPNTTQFIPLAQAAAPASTTQFIPVTEAAANPALTPFVAIPDVPEVIAAPVVVKAVVAKKPVIVKTKPVVQVVKNIAPVKAKFIPIKVATKPVVLKKAAPVKAKFVPVKVETKPVVLKKPVPVVKKTTAIAPNTKPVVVKKTEVKKVATKTVVIAEKPKGKIPTKPVVVDKKAVVASSTKKVVKK